MSKCYSCKMFSLGSGTLASHLFGNCALDDRRYVYVSAFWNCKKFQKVEEEELTERKNLIKKLIKNIRESALQRTLA